MPFHLCSQEIVAFFVGVGVGPFAIRFVWWRLKEWLR